MNSKILVVDDEKKLVDFIRQYLESRNYEVSVAYSGKEALATAKKTRPDIIILDIMMSGMDGLEVLRRIKEDPETNSAKVIMLTAKTETGTMFEAEKMLATDYIIKPFGLEKLKEVIDKYII